MFLKAAEACHKAGKPFGIGVGNTGDSNDTIGAIFHSFGAMLANEKGDITVKTDAVRQVPSSIEKMVVASGGYDLPSFEKLAALKVWAEEVPPKGTLYHYPNPHNHQILSVAGAPAPHKITEQIDTASIQCQMAVRYANGEALEKTLARAANEVEGFMRN